MPIYLDCAIVMCKILSLDSPKFTNWQYIGNEILRKSIRRRNPTQNHFGATFVPLVVVWSDCKICYKIQLPLKSISRWKTLLEQTFWSKKLSWTSFWVITLIKENLKHLPQTINEMSVLNQKTFGELKTLHFYLLETNTS